MIILIAAGCGVLVGWLARSILATAHKLDRDIPVLLHDIPEPVSHVTIPEQDTP